MIEKHERFMIGRAGGIRANLAYYDLSNMSFVKRNLSDADFTGSKLCEADMRGATLDRATLFCTDMRTSICKRQSCACRSARRQPAWR